jgi:hypothetical protein
VPSFIPRFGPDKKKGGKEIHKVETNEKLNKQLNLAIMLN